MRSSIFCSILGVLLIATASHRGYAQIPNPGFESWTAGNPDSFMHQSLRQAMPILVHRPLPEPPSHSIYSSSDPSSQPEQTGPGFPSVHGRLLFTDGTNLSQWEETFWSSVSSWQRGGKVSVREE
jgi:hypothetical protein